MSWNLNHGSRSRVTRFSMIVFAIDWFWPISYWSHLNKISNLFCDFPLFPTMTTWKLVGFAANIVDFSVVCDRNIRDCQIIEFVKDIFCVQVLKRKLQENKNLYNWSLFTIYVCLSLNVFGSRYYLLLIKKKS